MKITKVHGILVVTGKWDTVVRTPFGSFTADNHEDGIAQANAYVSRYR